MQISFLQPCHEWKRLIAPETVLVLLVEHGGLHELNIDVGVD